MFLFKGDSRLRSKIIVVVREHHDTKAGKEMGCIYISNNKQINLQIRKYMQVPIRDISAPLHAKKACGGKKYRSTIS